MKDDYKILLATGVLALIYTIYKRDKLSIIVMSGISIALVIGIFDIPYKSIILSSLLVICAFLGGVKGVLLKKTNTIVKFSVIIPSAVFVVKYTALLFYYDFSFFKIAIIAALVTVIAGLVKGLLKQADFGFILFFTVNFILTLPSL